MPNVLGADYASEMYGHRRGDSRHRSRSRRSIRGRGSPSLGRARDQGSPAERTVPPVEGSPSPPPVIDDSTYLPDLFWYRVPPEYASSEFLKSSVMRLSQHHEGHGTVRTENEVLSVADFIFDMGVHDLQQITVQSGQLIDGAQSTQLNTSEMRVLRDVIDMSEKLRRWCLTQPAVRARAKSAAKAHPVPPVRRDLSPRRSRSRRRRRSDSRPGNRRRMDESERARRSEDDAVERVRRDKDTATVVHDLLASNSLSDLDRESLPDPRLIVEIWNVCQRTSSPYLSLRPLEDWVPQYVLQGLGPKERSVKIAERKEKELSAEVLIENVMAYWLSHAAAGVVQVTAVMHHLQMLVRMLQKRPIRHVLQYSKLLPAHVSNKIAAREGSVAEYLVCDLDAVHKKAFEMAKSSGKGRNTKPKSKSPKRTQNTSTPRPGQVPIHEQVCLKHDLAQSKTCPEKDKGCPRVHLDTRKSEDRTKFDEAKQIVRGLARQKRKS